MAVPGTWLQANLGQHDGFQPPPPYPDTAQVGGLSLLLPLGLSGPKPADGSSGILAGGLGGYG